MDNKIFKADEAWGLFGVVTNYLLYGDGDLPASQRRGLGRLLSEIGYSLEGDDDESDPLPPNVRPIR